MFYFGITSLINYTEAKEVEKNGHFLKGIVLEKFCKNRGASYLTVELLGEGFTKELHASNCKAVEIGNTIIVKFLYPSIIMLEYKDGEILFGPNNWYSVVIGFVLTFSMLFIAINKNINLTNPENYVLWRKKYFYRKGEKHSRKKSRID
jgi:hypothetical protein